MIQKSRCCGLQMHLNYRGDPTCPSCGLVYDPDYRRTAKGIIVVD